MKFISMSVKKFNKKFGLKLKERENLSNSEYYAYVNDMLENSSLMYMSTSLNKEDIIEGLEEECKRLKIELKDYKKTGLELIELEGIYMGIDVFDMYL